MPLPAYCGVLDGAEPACGCVSKVNVVLLLLPLSPWDLGEMGGKCYLSQPPRCPRTACLCDCIVVKAGSQRVSQQSHLRSANARCCECGMVQTTQRVREREKKHYVWKGNEDERSKSRGTSVKAAREKAYQSFEKV